MKTKLKSWQKAGLSPTQRSLAWLRENGYEFMEKTEHIIPRVHQRRDLFEFIDILAVNHVHLLAIQCCAGDGGDHADRVHRIMRLPVARALAYYMDIQVWSFAIRGERGAPKMWTRRATPLTAKLLPKDSLLREKIEQGTWDVVNVA